MRMFSDAVAKEFEWPNCRENTGLNKRFTNGMRRKEGRVKSAVYNAE